MNHIKFYYLENENEPKIIMIDEEKSELYSIDRSDLTSIDKIEYHLNEQLKELIAESIYNGYDGSWENILFILDEPEILKNLALSENREEYIKSIKTSVETVETSNDLLIERFWKRFENQTGKIANKYIKIYKKCVDHLVSLDNTKSNNLLSETESLSNKEYFDLIIKIAKVSNSKIDESHFSF